MKGRTMCVYMLKVQRREGERLEIYTKGLGAAFALPDALASAQLMVFSVKFIYATVEIEETW